MKKQYLSPQMTMCVFFNSDVLTTSGEAYTVDDFKLEWLGNG